jgi:hypothetical protein
MPVTSATVSVGTAVVQVSSFDSGKKYVYLQDGDFAGDTEVYVGDGSVTTANGIKLSKTNTTVFETYQDDSLFAICSAAGGSVRVLEVK